MKSEKIVKIIKIISAVVVFSVFLSIAFYYKYSNETLEDRINYCKYFMTYYSPIWTGLSILSGTILLSFNIISEFPTKESKNISRKNIITITIQSILLFSVILFFGIALSQSL